ncbi:RTA1 domain-containing protein [Rutstroemia sp. NJR-2017a BVV2]|nr:RTA1 domain-containing protein [Rutstroemia sp. NJR-2017a BVV2]
MNSLRFLTMLPHSLLVSAIWVLVLVKFPDSANARHIPRGALVLSPRSRVASSDDGIASMAVPTALVCASEGGVYDVYGSLSFPAALGLTIIFGVLTIVHTGQAIYYLKPYTYPLLTSTLWTFLSFLLLSLPHPHPLLPLLSTNLLLISPLWLTTYLHLLLPHLTTHFLPTHSLLSLRAPVLRVLSLIFTLPVAGLQVVGVMRGVENHGRILFALGVMLQGVGVLIFIGMLGVLDREVRRLESGGVLERGKKGWRRGVWTGYGSAGMVLVGAFFFPLMFLLLSLLLLGEEINTNQKDHPPIPSHSPPLTQHNAK